MAEELGQAGGVGIRTRSMRKTQIGLVVSDKMQKTVVVEIVRRGRHPLYKKIVRQSRRFKAHDEQGEAHVGDKVLISETRPLSKDKRWRVVQVLERAR
ncbi:MAG TPA: 30S ribosomal protein S17 [bacterium]|nr:30S ribosomal protein S17 [bacterium]